MFSHTTDSALGDVEFLARSEHRVEALLALTEGALSRRDLRDRLDASPSTIGRMLEEFEKRCWIEKCANRYEATQLGAFVVTGIEDLLSRIETERTLRGVWHLLPTGGDGLDIEAVSQSVVTIAEVEDPYRPVNRFLSLLQETEQFRFVGFDLALLEPCKDVLGERIVDGMETTVIDPPGVARYILSMYSEHCAEPMESGNLTVKVHDELPAYGISLFDDRVAISGYHPESGTVQVLIDTDASDVCEWAETTFEHFERESQPLDFVLAVG